MLRMFYRLRDIGPGWIPGRLSAQDTVCLLAKDDPLLYQPFHYPFR